MAGSANKYRHLSRDSAHRQALLRNLVTSLFQHESITTTWPKAKEAQRLAERLITLGKKNTEGSRKAAIATFYVCCLSLSCLNWEVCWSCSSLIRVFRRPTISCPNSSVPSVNATWNAPVVIHESSASSPKKMTKHLAPFSNSSMDRRICGLP